MACDLWFYMPVASGTDAANGFGEEAWVRHGWGLLPARTEQARRVLAGAMRGVEVPVSSVGTAKLPGVIIKYPWLQGARLYQGPDSAVHAKACRGGSWWEAVPEFGLSASVRETARSRLTNGIDEASGERHMRHLFDRAAVCRAIERASLHAHRICLYLGGVSGETLPSIEEAHEFGTLWHAMSHAASRAGCDVCFAMDASCAPENEAAVRELEAMLRGVGVPVELAIWGEAYPDPGGWMDRLGRTCVMGEAAWRHLGGSVGARTLACSLGVLQDGPASEENLATLEEAATGGSARFIAVNVLLETPERLRRLVRACYEDPSAARETI